MEDEIKVTPWGIVAALFIAVLVVVAALCVFSLRTADAYLLIPGALWVLGGFVWMFFAAIIYNWAHIHTGNCL